MTSVLLFKLFVLVTYLQYMESANIGLARHRPRNFDDNTTTTIRPNFRERVSNRILRYRQRNTKTICYDVVGCFDVQHSRSPLQKSPESPTALDTKFYLFRRNLKFSEPDVIYYDDEGKSLNSSMFNPTQPLKMYIHGFSNRWNDKGVFVMADAYLKLTDCNFVIMDWSKGARGPQYATAAANTEIAGRQLGVLMLNMIEKGLNPKNIHLLGFSLGAHVAGCAGEFLKSKGFLIGRITGLDAAAPLFRRNYLKERSKKLDETDAEFVDVLHTDSSPVFADGFGLWEPIGHVDFFANGGEEQPGCTDTPNSVVATTLDRSLSRDTACSHIRAVDLFTESLLNIVSNNTCEFIAYKCPGGLPSFKKGQCFPQIENITINPLALDKKYYTDIGRMGQLAEGNGVMYFVTTERAPFCGTQLQSLVTVSSEVNPTKGVLVIKLPQTDTYNSFKIEIDTTNIPGTMLTYGLTAVDSNILKSREILARLSYYSYIFVDEKNITISFPKRILVNKIHVRDIYTNRWTYCGKDVVVGEKRNVAVKLTKDNCLEE